MYLFTDKQKAELFDAGMTLNDVVNFHNTDDNAWLTADEAMEVFYRWYMDDGMEGERDIPSQMDGVIIPASPSYVEHEGIPF